MYLWSIGFATVFFSIGIAGLIWEGSGLNSNQRLTVFLLGVSFGVVAVAAGILDWKVPPKQTW
jgi:hypothetical protein